MARQSAARAILVLTAVGNLVLAAIALSVGWYLRSAVATGVGLAFIGAVIIWILERLRPTGVTPALVTTTASTTRVTYRREFVRVRLTAYLLCLPLLIALPITVAQIEDSSIALGIGVALALLELPVALALIDHSRRAFIPTALELTPHGLTATLPNEDVDLAWQALAEIRMAHDVNGRMLYLGAVPEGIARRARHRFFKNYFRSVGIAPPLVSIPVPLVGLPVPPASLAATLMTYATDPQARTHIGTVASVRELTEETSVAPVRIHTWDIYRRSLN